MTDLVSQELSMIFGGGAVVVAYLLWNFRKLVAQRKKINDEYTARVLAVCKDTKGRVIYPSPTLAKLWTREIEVAVEHECEVDGHEENCEKCDEKPRVVHTSDTRDIDSDVDISCLQCEVLDDDEIWHRLRAIEVPRTHPHLYVVNGELDKASVVPDKKFKKGRNR